MRAFKSKSYRLGYRDGRLAGYDKGREIGIGQGMQDRLSMPAHGAPQAVASAGRALVIPAAMELPTLEIVVLQPLRELQRQGAYDFAVKAEHEVTEGDIAGADTVIFIRNVEPGALPLLTRALEMGKKAVYVIDDYFLETPQGTPIHHYYSDPARRQTYLQFMSRSSRVMVASAFFADFIRLHYNPNVAYFPASVDFTLFDETPRAERNDGRLIIGYEGTNKDHDFIPVVPALKLILQEFGDRVKLLFHGYMPGELQHYPQVEYQPMVSDYRTYMQHLYQSSWDIGLAPLSDTLFNHCKTNNKFREYAACLIPGVYSQSPAYQDWVIHGETGYSVPHTVEGWYEGIKQMITNPALRQKIRDQASSHARSHFSVAVCANNWLGHILRV